MPYRALLDLIDADAEGLATMRAKIRAGERVTLTDVANQQSIVNRMYQLIERVPYGRETPTDVIPQLDRAGEDDGTEPGGE